MSHEGAWQDLQALVTGQSLAVLATDQDGHPYSSLVAFVATEELKHVLFAATRNTRKYRNLNANPRVSLLVDSRTNTEKDFHAAMAVTILGTVGECASDDAALHQLFLNRHPHLASFVGSPDCALLCVEVSSYSLVRRFQDVVELTP